MACPHAGTSLHAALSRILRILIMHILIVIRNVEGTYVVEDRKEKGRENDREGMGIAP